MKPVDQSLWLRRHDSPEDEQKLREEFLSSKGKGWLLRWLPSRAHDNGLFVLFSNGVGVDDDEVMELTIAFVARDLSSKHIITICYR